MKSITITILLCSLLTASLAIAQDKPAPAPLAPAALPGHGLAEHDFLYAGEAKDRHVFIVRKGQIAWAYDDPQGKGEISDAALLSNGNVLLAHQYAVLHNADRESYYFLLERAGMMRKPTEKAQGKRAVGQSI